MCSFFQNGKTLASASNDAQLICEGDFPFKGEHEGGF
jgi:hypothetical protein